MTELQRLRITKGLTQSKLAELSGITLRNVQYYEQGRLNIDGAKISTLLKIANALDCQISDIVENQILSNELKNAGY